MEEEKETDMGRRIENKRETESLAPDVNLSPCHVWDLDILFLLLGNLCFLKYLETNRKPHLDSEFFNFREKTFYLKIPVGKEE